MDILASERIDEVREAVKAWCREEGLTAWDRETQTGLLRNLVVREGRRTEKVQARIVTSPGSDFRVEALAAATPADSFLWTRAEGVAETTRGGKTKAVKGRCPSRRSSPGSASGSLPMPSSRPTPRWRSASMGRRPTSPA